VAAKPGAVGGAHTVALGASQGHGGSVGLEEWEGSEVGAGEEREKGEEEEGDAEAAKRKNMLEHIQDEGAVRTNVLLPCPPVFTVSASLTCVSAPMPLVC